MTARLDALRAALADELPAAVALRRRIHADPHLSGQETPTARLAVHALDAGDGVEVAGTGRLVPLGDGPCVVLRAELDALPVVERTGVAWAATGTAMHACGHDVHVAAVVAVARAIRRAGGPAVAALFQPREERPPSGARDVIASGALRDVAARAVIAAHVQPRVAAGVIAVTPGVVNASVDEFEVVVTGAGGHVGYPHTVRDPVLALCQVVVNLQALTPRGVDPVHGAVCMVGQVHGGTASNVVPDEASAAGSIRLMRASDRAPVLARMREIVEHTAAAHGCTGEFRVVEGEPVLDNDPALAAGAADWLATMDHPVQTDFRSFGADDFSYYGHEVPSLMAFVGTGGERGLHDARFLPGDGVVALAADALLAGYLAATGPDAGDPVLASA